MNNARALGEEIEFKKGGMIQQRAQQVLQDATELLEHIEQEGMFDILSRGVFADVFRPVDGGKGHQGVYRRSPEYWNPLEDAMRDRLGLS